MNPYYEVDKKAITDILDQKLTHNRERVALMRFFDSVLKTYGNPDEEKRLVDLFDMLMDEQANPMHICSLMFCFMLTPVKLRRLPNNARIMDYIGHKLAGLDYSAHHSLKPAAAVQQTLDRLLADPVAETPAVSLDTLTQLQTLCEEYESWLQRMARTENFNPKNHPTPRSLRERDTIRLKIQALATPEVILELVKIAKKERGEL